MNTIKDIKKGDFFTFVGNDNKYKGLFCTSCHKEKSPFYFIFAALTYDDIQKPTLEDFINCNFFGTAHSKKNPFKYSDKALEQMWNNHPEIKPYHIGSYWFIIWRKDFLKFRNNFEFVGNLNIVDNLDKNGNSGVNASSWDFLTDFFSEKYKTVLDYRGQTTFKVKSIIST
ncbi:MAG: hypothetical protein ACOVQA_10425 [Thermoflexibacteraceae bacterium]|jgi:hypothetical protein